METAALPDTVALVSPLRIDVHITLDPWSFPVTEGVVTNATGYVHTVEDEELNMLPCAKDTFGIDIVCSQIISPLPNLVAIPFTLVIVSITESAVSKLLLPLKIVDISMPQLIQKYWKKNQ